MDMRSLSKYNDKYKYLECNRRLLEISTYRAARSKTGTAVSSAFQSILAKYSKPVRRRPTWLRTDRCKVFLNSSFQTMLRKEGIQFRLCRDPNVKCAIVESSHRTVPDKLYKHMICRNTYRYIEVLPKFVRCYNDTIQSTTGMAPCKVMDPDIIAIWNRMRSKHSSIRCEVVRFSVGQHVRISK